MDRTSRCARPGCGGRAAATMTYDYSSRTLTLYTPGNEPDESDVWGLCASHAGSMRVPVGWARRDERVPIIPIRSQIAV